MYLSSIPDRADNCACVLEVNRHYLQPLDGIGVQYPKIFSKTNILLGLIYASGSSPDFEPCEKQLTHDPEANPSCRPSDKYLQKMGTPVNKAQSWSLLTENTA